MVASAPQAAHLFEGTGAILEEQYKLAFNACRDRNTPVEGRSSQIGETKRQETERGCEKESQRKSQLFLELRSSLEWNKIVQDHARQKIIMRKQTLLRF